MLWLSGLLSACGDVLSFSVPGGRGKNGSMWFGRGDQYPGWHYPVFKHPLQNLEEGSH